MVKFLLRKTRTVFPSLVVIITAIIAIMALKHSHLKELTMAVSLKCRIKLIKLIVIIIDGNQLIIRTKTEPSSSVRLRQRKDWILCPSAGLVEMFDSIQVKEK